MRWLNNTTNLVSYRNRRNVTYPGRWSPPPLNRKTYPVRNRTVANAIIRFADWECLTPGMHYERFHHESGLMISVWISNDRLTWNCGIRQNWFDFDYIHKIGGFATVHHAITGAENWANKQ